jgi:hypothetical protein
MIGALTLLLSFESRSLHNQLANAVSGLVCIRQREGLVARLASSSRRQNGEDPQDAASARLAAILEDERVPLFVSSGFCDVADTMRNAGVSPTRHD